MNNQNVANTMISASNNIITYDFTSISKNSVGDEIEEEKSHTIPLTEEQKKHKTEVDLDDYDKFDLRIINTTLEKLKEDAKNIYTKYEG